ncbi:CPBP family intramembrane glutamic endopeptidase [Streptomyces sp. AJS327]|uniref:CPBP family intramembrane glutamic endopeptidase n=1 Tax=Streptomyces sp. AJS327 TaxID=2545265 RepID=UPI0027E3D61F|nr:CPBP family intramembrane glutamic endopeptidase [Streptomyces sp. AJS327]
MPAVQLVSPISPVSSVSPVSSGDPLASVAPDLPLLLDYAARVLPGLVLVAGCFLLAGPLRDPLARIALLIGGFVLVRDAMTPVGLWRVGTTESVPWLRMLADPALLLALGGGTLAATWAVLRADRRLSALVVWGRADLPTVACGLGGGLLAAAPVLALSATVPQGERGGAVAASILPVLAFFTLTGNLAEEVLFRGLLQGRLATEMSGAQAAVCSALAFAACHAFLASTVTDAGWPLLVFTLYEGLICAFLRLRRGVLAAALAHGSAIFLLAAALF